VKKEFYIIHSWAGASSKYIAGRIKKLATSSRAEWYKWSGIAFLSSRTEREKYSRF
jgi:hypothetical protein